MLAYFCADFDIRISDLVNPDILVTKILRHSFNQPTIFVIPPVLSQPQKNHTELYTKLQRHDVAFFLEEFI